MIHKMSNTTRLVDKLIDKKLVQRQICEENRRKIEIFITIEGLQLLKKIDIHIDKKEEQLTQELNTEEKEKLVALIQPLI